MLHKYCTLNVFFLSINFMRMNLHTTPTNIVRTFRLKVDFHELQSNVFMLTRNKVIFNYKNFYLFSISIANNILYICTRLKNRMKHLLTSICVFLKM